MNPVLAAAPMFLATYFLDNGQDGVYLAVSKDGYRFEPLLEPNMPILKPQVGPDRLCRDACICKGPDGTWHMVWTTGWWDRGIGLAHSKDLVHWSGQKSIPVMEAIPNTLNAWAPEIAYDSAKHDYVLYWSSTVTDRFLETLAPAGDRDGAGKPLNHRYYFTTTQDFHRYEPTKLLWDPGFNCIDATLFHDGGRWLLFGKDETKAPVPKKHLFVASAPSTAGPFAMITPKITGNYWAEGPTAVKVGDTYRVYFDRYVDGHWGAVESNDLQTWSDVSDRIHMPAGARHGTIVKTSPQEVEEVRKALRNRGS